ncbi:hypothetical protein P7B04_07020 [Sphingobium yanoikuyae]|uniref:hypothetical protein n=1 Tax=Sphingobium yanoikuyae TaxID=13690 RepID=UPI00240F2DA4|nr:hypothetical protein [Sphingobium yanoikuyae]MDG2512447.1 hypothetical protein [Sphingobium yanoikuyae]
MAATQKYVCARAMTDNGRDYGRGDEIELAEADAVNLLSIGAIAESKEAAPPAPKPKPAKPA